MFLHNAEDYQDLWQWSVENYADFWEEFFYFSDICFAQAYDEVREQRPGVPRGRHVEMCRWLMGQRALLIFPSGSAGAN
jgi:acetoacetyl-CoA synthetase